MPNFDQGEIAKFSHDTGQWWDPEGEYRPLHDLNPTRLGFIKNHLSLDDACVLDVGCGGGILAESMAREGAYVTGIDMNSNAIDAAREHAGYSNLAIDYQNISIEEHSSNHYDAVTCMELLEHVPDPESFVGHCAGKIKDGGWLFFSTLNRNLTSFMTAIIGAEYVLRVLPRGTHHYAKLIRPSELGHWAQEHGAQVKTVNGLHYNPITRTSHLKDKPKVNYILACYKPEKTEQT